MPGSQEERKRKRKKISKQCYNLGRMLKRLKKIDEHQQDQSEEFTITKGINRCNSLDAEAQQAQSNMQRE